MSTAATAGKRILLVEDDRFLQRACGIAMRRRGFTVALANNGLEALEAVRREVPDLILLDMLMPKLSGVETLRALRADPALRDIPVLILSNSSREQDITEVTRLGIVGYWVKSNVSLHQLGERVESFFARDGDA